MMPIRKRFEIKKRWHEDYESKLFMKLMDLLNEFNL
jgi:hypothetical protein